MMDFLNHGGWLVYVLIFFGKILEVTISTLRVVLITRGERVKGSIVAIFEVLTWLLVTGTVLIGLTEDIIRVVVFVVAFAIGIYFGSWLEDKLAFGLCSMQVIMNEASPYEEVLHILRENKFAVTTLKGQGKDGEREIMLLHLKRKRISKATELIKASTDNAVIVINDSKVVYGGFIKK